MASLLLDFRKFPFTIGYRTVRYDSVLNVFPKAKILYYYGSIQTKRTVLYRTEPYDTPYRTGIDNRKSIFYQSKVQYGTSTGVN